MSDRHIDEAESSQVRTSSTFLTFVNKTKGHIGITALATTKFIADAGVYTALLGIALVLITNMYTAWLLIKARNRFKNHNITTLHDLAMILFGEEMAVLIGVIQVSTCLFACFVYQSFLGQQLDQLMCETLEVTECGQK